jgi:hypothetical protein
LLEKFTEHENEEKYIRDLKVEEFRGRTAWTKSVEDMTKDDEELNQLHGSYQWFDGLQYRL